MLSPLVFSLSRPTDVVETWQLRVWVYHCSWVESLVGSHGGRRQVGVDGSLNCGFLGLFCTARPSSAGEKLVLYKLVRAVISSPPSSGPWWGQPTLRVPRGGP